MGYAMKLFLDENIPVSAVDAIKSLGFEVEHVKSSGLRGASDKEIAKYAKSKQAILVTRDIEFGSSLLYPKGSHYGVIVIRLPHSFTTKQMIAHLVRFLKGTEYETLADTVTVLEIDRFRRRKMI
ncbi:MAG: DUF5615 family PIN-like protein [Candidatus Aenigmarchaeota archaeon]|nr:DUF5615 family PIN-like protein [Candidatus Aenigmarchaeota archaeon]